MSGTFGNVDASIPLQAGRGVTQPENPLQTAGQFINLKQGMNALSLFPGQQKLQSQAVQGGAINLAQHQYQATAQALLPLLQTAPPGTLTHDTVTTALAGAEHAGMITQPFMARLLAQAPQGDGPGFDAAVRAAVASGSQTDAGNALGTVTTQRGPYVPSPDNSGAQQPTLIAPAGAPRPGMTTVAGAPIATGLSAVEGTAPTAVGVVPPGQPNAGAPIMQPLRATPFAPGAPSAFPNGARNLPPALRNPNAPPAAPPVPAVPIAPTAAAVPPVPGVVTSLGPAGTAAAAQTGAQSATAFQSIADQGVQAKAQAAVLDTMLGDTSQFVTGPGAEGIRTFKSVMQRLSPSIAAAFGISPDSIAANESFDKFQNQLALAQNPGNIPGLAVSGAANPHASQTPAGVDLILRQLRGNADYAAARAQLAQAYPDKSDRQGFETNVAANLDPRVFQIARMTPQQQGTFYNSMADKPAFRKAYAWAEQQGLIPNAAQ